MRTLPLQTVIANNVSLVKAAQILGIPQSGRPAPKTTTLTGGWPTRALP